MMEQKDNITPEERLLKIIESPTGEIPRRRPLPAAKQQANASFNVDKIIAALKGMRINKDTFKNLKNIDLALVNKIAICACGLITFIWLVVSIRDSFALRARFDRIKTGSSMSASSGELAPDINVNIDGLLAAARSHNIFAALPVTQASQGSRQAQGPGGASTGAVSIASASADVKLVGIIWSDNPQAMLEDTKDQKTYLLAAGESVGNFKVKEIFQNKIIVESQGKEFELR
jgi:hypothetical protein